MQIVIDISKDRYDEIMSMDWKNGRLIFDEEIRAIHDGKALEQEPCDDCVSRQAVIDAIENDNRNGHYSCFATNNDAQCFKDVIRELPSVTVQQKMGEWKRINKEKYVQHAMSYYRCSECGKEIIGKHNYCPNCGCKMQEVQDE